MDVLIERAAALQQVDGELAHVDALLASGGSGAAGACPSCRAPHARGAAFCWQCGTALVAEGG
jgi:predicted amidophosphoribosyltransferase